MKSALPAIVIGLVLVVIVFLARCSQLKMHEYEISAERNGNPNAVENDIVEKDILAHKFPDTLLMPSGIRYKILKEGTGTKPIAGSHVKAHYAGRLLDGTEFDSSYKRGTPHEFVILQGQVIRGWDFTVLDMRRGEKRFVVIPYKLAYGNAGRPPAIPSRAPLVFEIELVE